MRFKYKAFDKNGRIIEGELEVANESEVLSYLNTNQLKPMAVDSVNPRTSRFSLGHFFNSIKEVDKLFLIRYLVLLLKAGTDILQSINLLLTGIKKPALKDILNKIQRNLEKGRPFYLAFEEYKNQFSPVFVSLIKAGERSGTLVEVLEDLHKNSSEEYEYKKQLRASLIYPVVLLIMALVVITVLVMFVLPNLAKVVIVGGAAAKIPAFSRIVFTGGLFLKKYMLLIYGLLFIIAISLWIIFTKTEKGRRFLTKLLNQLPIFKNVMRQYALGKSLSTLALLIRAGVSLTEAIDITAQTINHIEMREALIKIAREDLVRGVSLGEALKRYDVFPLIMSNLITISEKAGRIEEVARNLGEFYNHEVNSEIKRLLSLLEPIILIVMGLGVGFIAISIIVPIYQLITSF